MNRLISTAVELRASDIHLEPTESALHVRFRVDGVMQERDPLPASMRGAAVSRIKVMAGLNIAERRLPQDGRLKLAVRGHDIDLRVATSPTIYGEGVVLRLLDRSHLTLDFEALGFDPPLLARGCGRCWPTRTASCWSPGPRARARPPPSMRRCRRSTRPSASC